MDEAGSGTPKKEQSCLDLAKKDYEKNSKRIVK